MAVPSQFVLMFPCFAIMSENGRGAVIQELSDGRIALVLLSDEDLLRRYRVEHQFVGPTIRFEFTPQLVLYLDTLPPEVTHVIVDPARTGFTASIADFVQKFSRGISE